MNALKLALAVAVLAGPAAAAPACAPGLHATQTAQLFFGRGLGDDTVGVSLKAWADFLDAEVTPRFPDGLSVFDVYGQWRGPAGPFVRETTKAVLIVLAGAPDEEAKLKAIRDAYKERFHQQSVLLVEQDACVSF